MDRISQATQNFISVRDSLNSPATLQTFRIAHYKPLLFYLEHSKDEAIAALLKETGESISAKANALEKQ